MTLYEKDFVKSKVTSHIVNIKKICEWKNVVLYSHHFGTIFFRAVDLNASN